MEQNSLEKRFDALIDRLEERFNLIDKRFDAMYEYMSTSFREIRQDIRAIHGRLSDVEEKSVDTEDRLAGAERAIDKDAVRLMGHEKRIRRMEKAA